MERVARTLTLDGTYEDWRRQARALLRLDYPPAAVAWVDPFSRQQGIEGLTFDAGAARSVPAAVSVPRRFLDKAKAAAYHRDAGRWALLYRMAFRLTHGERTLLSDDLDPDVRLLETMTRQVARDIHKMHAFVRFREIQDEAGSRFIAWHRPDHFIVRPASSFFVERFPTMRWSILTPEQSVHWDGAAVVFGPGVPQSAAPQQDQLEDLWRTYYASMFNPARLNPRAMTRELPVRHWPTLPEARLIPALIAEAPARVGRMIDAPGRASSARGFVPEGASLDQLRAASADCRGCALYQQATQVVFGEGPSHTPLMLVGEQPGDEEDQQGRPFVGPAGAVLDRALTAAHIERDSVYLTNAVKHFTFERRGKRRIHSKPRAGDVRACRPWLEAEIDRVRPEAIVCLGGTAAQALLGPSIRIQRDRGKSFTASWAARVIVTYHPSAVLRAEDPAHSEEIFNWLVKDLGDALHPKLLSSAVGP